MCQPASTSIDEQMARRPLSEPYKLQAGNPCDAATRVDARKQAAASEGGGFDESIYRTAIEIAQDPASMFRPSSFRCRASVAELGGPPAALSTTALPPIDHCVRPADSQDLAASAAKAEPRGVGRLH